MIEPKPRPRPFPQPETSDHALRFPPRRENNRPRPVKNDEGPQPANLGRPARIVLVANILATLLGLLATPLVARSVGPVGRGELAAIITPVTILSYLLPLGAQEYVVRELVRRPNDRYIMTNAAILMLTISLIALVPGFAFATFVGDGRREIVDLVRLQFLLMPITLIMYCATFAALAQGRWRVFALSRVLPQMLIVASLIVVATFGRITVWGAAMCYIFGSLAGSSICLRARTFGGPRYVRASELRRCVLFGLRSWFGSVAALTNQRLDILLMTRLTSSSELGLYASATTFASAPALIANAIASPVRRRATQGDTASVVRGTQIALAGVLVSAATLAVVTPAVITLLLGPSFSGAIVMCWMLLIASVPAAGSAVLAPCLVSAGRPLRSSIGEVAAVLVTIIGLTAYVSRFGGVGAAGVSIVACASSYAVLSYAASKTFEVAWLSLLFPPTSSFGELRSLLARAPRQIKARLRSA